LYFDNWKKVVFKVLSDFLVFQISGSQFFNLWSGKMWISYLDLLTFNDNDIGLSYWKQSLTHHPVYFVKCSWGFTEFQILSRLEMFMAATNLFKVVPYREKCLVKRDDNTLIAHQAEKEAFKLARQLLMSYGKSN
jgi:hypothetical protein